MIARRRASVSVRFSRGVAVGQVFHRVGSFAQPLENVFGSRYAIRVRIGRFERRRRVGRVPKHVRGQRDRVRFSFAISVIAFGRLASVGVVRAENGRCVVCVARVVRDAAERCGRLARARRRLLLQHIRGSQRLLGFKV